MPSTQVFQGCINSDVEDNALDAQSLISMRSGIVRRLAASQL